MFPVTRSSPRLGGMLAAFLTVALLALPIDADESNTLLPFVAVYDVIRGGIRVGSVETKFEIDREGRYLLQQTSKSRGIATLVGPAPLFEVSRGLRVGTSLRPLEYESRRKGGDADDNVHFVFDWPASSVRNIGAEPRFQVSLEPGDLDPLLMFWAMRSDLERGLRSMRYTVPRQGRRKTYAFAAVGEEEVRVPQGEYRTLRVDRTDDLRDQTTIWSAPEFGYLAVRILKSRERGLDTELRLRSLEVERL